MKSLKTLRIPLLFGAFGAFLFFAPTSRAQECDPQHFEDSVAPAPAKQHAAPKKATTKQAALQSSNGNKAMLQPAASRQSRQGQNSVAVVVSEKQALKKPESDQQ